MNIEDIKLLYKILGKKVEVKVNNMYTPSGIVINNSKIKEWFNELKDCYDIILNPVMLK